MTKELYEDMGAGYYDKVATSGNPVQVYWHANRFAKIISKIKINENTKILDIGCGPGTLLAKIKPVYKLAVGIDFDEKQISFARKKFNNRKNIKWIYGDVTKLNIKNKFDYIICSELIEHIEPSKADKLMTSINHLLSQDGKLILTTPNYRSLWPMTEWFVNRLGKVDYSKQHINKLNIESAKRVLKKNGFKIEKLETFYIISPFLAFISTNLSKILQNVEKNSVSIFGIRNNN